MEVKDDDTSSFEQNQNNQKSLIKDVKSEPEPEPEQKPGPVHDNQHQDEPSTETLLLLTYS